jgi:16S rRNA (guanine527-N7)-methyltransferase
VKPELRDLLVTASDVLGVKVSESEARKLLSLADELLRWNKKVNLTAITDEREVVLKHLVDSISVIPYLPQRGKIVDLGSGGGFPSIVIGILRPELEIVSVDSVEKKIIFQKHAVRLLNLSNVIPIHARAEALVVTHPQYFDAAVSRAFAALPLFVRLAAPLVREGGGILAMKGREGREEAAAAEAAAAEGGVMIADVCEFLLPVAGDVRSVVVIKRTRIGQC